MTRVFLVLVISTLVPTLAFGQPSQVELEDLIPVANDLSSLADPLLGVFESQVQIAAAEARVEQAKIDLKVAERLVEIEESDHDASKAELKAAEKNGDAHRMNAPSVSCRILRQT